LLKPDNDARPTFLFGAGTSFSSGIPLAGESVNRLAKQVYAERVLGRKTLIERIKVSKWTDWLHRQGAKAEMREGGNIVRTNSKKP
jgi:hypothetical protein